MVMGGVVFFFMVIDTAQGGAEPNNHSEGGCNAQRI